MLTYSFTDTGSDSLYEYLYKCIKKDIITGVLPPNYKLPSKRSFAKNLGISTITVETAYAQLNAEGYIYSIPKKGFYTVDIYNEIKTRPVIHKEDIQIIESKKEYFADFASNQTCPDNFPFSIWAKLMREVISEKSTELMANSPGGGIMELRTAVCGHLMQFRGISILPEQVIIGAGTEYLYGLLIQLLGYNKIYAVEDPGYKKIAQIYSSNHVDCRHIPLDRQGILISSLEENNADIVHISPSHHYPTGIITPIGRRYELLGWASKSDSRYIIEDDYDSEFRLMGNPIPTLQSIDVMEKVIYINTFTKSLASTIRISYMVLPKHLIERFYDKLSFYSCTVSNFEQYTLAKFISEGYLEKHINRMRNYYRNLRDLIMNAIKNSPLSAISSITEEESGLHFLLYLNTPLSDKEIMNQAELNHIHVTCLSQYYTKTVHDKEHILVINYSGIQPDKVNESVSRLYKCIE